MPLTICCQVELAEDGLIWYVRKQLMGQLDPATYQPGRPFFIKLKDGWNFHPGTEAGFID